MNLKRLFGLLLCISIALFFLHFSSLPGKANFKKSESTSYFYFMQGVLAKKHGRLEDALLFFKRAQAWAPDALPPLIELAVLEFISGNLGEAERWVNEALSLDPENPECLLLMAKIYTLKNEPDKSLEALKKIKAKGPRQQEVDILMGSICLHKNDLDEAVAFFAKAIETGGPLTSSAYYYQGKVFKLKGENEKALQAFIAANRLEPDFPPVLLEIAAIFAETGRKEEADRTLTYLLKAHPHNWPLILEACRLYLRLKEYEKAVSCLEMVRKEAPDNSQAALLLAYAYEASGRYSAAINVLQSLARDPKFKIEAVMREAYLFKKLHNDQKAIKLIEDLYQAHPDSRKVILAIITLYNEKGRYAEAEHVLSKALKIFPKDKELFFYRAVALERLGQREKALPMAQKALALDGDYVPALNFVGYTYAEKGIHLDEAITMLQKASSLAPEDGYIMDSLGWAYFKRGDLQKALVLLQKAQEKCGDEPVVLEHLGDVYLSLGRFEKAAAAYKRAIEQLENDEAVQRIKEKIEKNKAKMRQEEQEGDEWYF